MLLDPPTLIVSSGLAAAVLCVVLLVSWLQDRETPALLWWSAAQAVGATGLAVYTSGEVAASAAREWGNALFLLGTGLVYAGACRFNGKPVAPALLLAGPVAWLAVVLTVDIGFSARVTYGSLLYAGHSAAAAWVMWRGENLIFQRAAAIICTIQAVFFLARMFAGPAIFIEGGTESLDSAWVRVMGVTSLLYVIVLGFFMMGMAKERTDLANRRAALSDPLTGVLNRRGFLAAGERVVAAAPGGPAAVMLFDLDHFKAVNDRHGHGVGDEVLIGFCDVLRAELQASAAIGRLGGEEFAVALSGDAAHDAGATAERVRRRFARTWEIRDGRAIEATVSAGVAVALNGRETLVALLSRADGALYRAKAAGRDRVEGADAAPAEALQA